MCLHGVRVRRAPNAHSQPWHRLWRSRGAQAALVRSVGPHAEPPDPEQDQGGGLTLELRQQMQERTPLWPLGGIGEGQSVLPWVSPLPSPSSAGVSTPTPLQMGGQLPVPPRRARGLTWHFRPASEPASPGACPGRRAPGRPPRQSAPTAPLGTGNGGPVTAPLPRARFPTPTSRERPQFKETGAPTTPEARRQLELRRGPLAAARVPSAPPPSRPAPPVPPTHRPGPRCARWHS